MATPPSANQGIPMPDDDEYLKDVPDFVRNMGLAIEKQLVMRFADTADRAAKVPSPEAGMLAYMEDTTQLALFDGTSWRTIAHSQPPITSGTADPAGSAVVGALYVKY